jgi:hypothetical protein
MDRGPAEPRREGDGQEGDHRGPVPPGLLSRRAAPPPLPPPVQESGEVASLHAKFARLVSGAQAEAPDAAAGGGIGSAAGGGGGVRAKVRARVAAVARADAGADREFMGDLVRALAALASRVDEVAARLGDLEMLVQEVVDQVSEDLVRVELALGALDDGRRSVPAEPAVPLPPSGGDD